MLRAVTSAGQAGVKCVAARVEGTSGRAAAAVGVLVAVEPRVATTGGAGGISRAPSTGAEGRSSAARLRRHLETLGLVGH